MKPILVTGATGTTGAEVVRQLAARGVPVRALVRDPAKAGALAALPGVTLVQADLAKPETLAAALDGVERAYLVTSPDPAQVALHSAFFKAAKAAGVKHIVRHSGLGADVNSPISLGRWHGESERELEASGIAWTHLQPHLFMQFFHNHAASIRDQGVFYAPLADAAVSMVDVRDIAAAAVVALTEPGHEGQRYAITGPAAVSFAEAAATLSAALGKPVQYVAVTPDQAREAMLGGGMPEWLATDLANMFGFFATGQAAFVSPAVEHLTGKPGHSFADFVRDNLVAFR
ncbi:NAD(P)H-binding protein [Niveibacterium umoris]|uniref:Uncharacterized protein YbjT (DUF2867 family) n=1 Tax=Niveibacterium umoris TaxID=1193620 RepID=A0A840BPT7_9RHOO|nr:SDR family oxidoreductase [Niveibacterium umoris]MBB4013692.1 uncharacterized protein YbjT (DUF2867 family) [Niveibacterium umoris]